MFADSFMLLNIDWWREGKVKQTERIYIIKLPWLWYAWKFRKGTYCIKMWRGYHFIYVDSCFCLHHINDFQWETLSCYKIFAQWLAIKAH